MNKPGNNLQIFQDPWTQETSEGDATLVKKLSEDDDFEYWEVHFDVDEPEETYPRFIKKTNQGVL